MHVPALMTQAQETATSLNEMTKSGIRLDKGTIKRLAAEDARVTWWGRLALWIGAISLAALAFLQWVELVR